MYMVDEMCYVGNIGDSRCILSLREGQELRQITRDHKPNDPIEKERIVRSGGSVYQTRIPATFTNNEINNELDLAVEFDQTLNKYFLLGPSRVIPGRLSVARTFGDLDAKAMNQNVIVSQVEIHQFEISKEMDFILIGSIWVYLCQVMGSLINWRTMKLWSRFGPIVIKMYSLI